MITEGSAVIEGIAIRIGGRTTTTTRGNVGHTLSNRSRQGEHRCGLQVGDNEDGDGEELSHLERYGRIMWWVDVEPGAVEEPDEQGIEEPPDLHDFLEEIRKRFRESSAEYVVKLES